jgi:uncharacterized protein YbjT (DUF2867 family)
MILITGATGTNGGEVLKRLVQQGVPVRAMVRNPAKADALRQPNVEIVEGDFDRPETLASALAGVERAFLVTNSTDRAEQQQLAFVRAAGQSGVKHIVKVSQIHADANSPVRFLRYHAAVEAAIKASGMAYTFLRPNLFMQGLLDFVPLIKEQNAFFAPIGDAKVSIVDVRDIADVAAAALTTEGHAGKTYDLTGPEALTHAQMAAYLSDVIGRPIAFVDIAPDAMRAAVVGMHMPEWQADGLIEDYAHYVRGEAAAVAPDIQQVTGKPARTFEAFVHDYASALS